MWSRPQIDLALPGRRVRLGKRTLTMGVLNVTPDSFSDGGRYVAPERAIAHGIELMRQGADWIDVGGESTRPGSKPVTAEEELRRVLPVVRGLTKRLPDVPVSIDTTKAEVAEAAVRAGAAIINDVSGLRFDARIADIARRHRTPLILMHLRGRPSTMQRGPFAGSVWRSVGAGLARSVRRALASGVHRSQLIIDPGLGFGKTRRQNFELLAGLRRLRRFRLPVMVGASRKSFVQAIVSGEGLMPARVRRLPQSAGGAGAAPSLWALTRGKALEAGTERAASLHLGDAAGITAAILAGAHIVRVHDVAAALPAVRIADAILAAAQPEPSRRRRGNRRGC